MKILEPECPPGTAYQTHEIVNSDNFLEIYRDIARSEKFVFGGTVLKKYAEFDSKYIDEAIDLADHQSEQLHRLVGGLVMNQDKFFDAYKHEFVKSVRFIGRNCLNQKEKYPFLAEAFLDEQTRSKIMLNVAREFRKNFYYLSTISLQRKRLGVEPWRAVKPHINSPSMVRSLVDEHSPNLGYSFIVKALKSRSYDSEDFLEYASQKKSELRKNPKYKDINLETINRAVAYHNDPEAYLDKIASDLESLSQSENALPDSVRMQIARDFNSQDNHVVVEQALKRLSNDQKVIAFGGKSIINKAIRLNPKDPDSVVAKIIDTYEHLRSNDTFKEIQSAHIKRIAISYVTIERATKVLEIGMSNYARLSSNKQFSSFFSKQILIDVAIHRKYNSEDFLKKTITRYKRIRKIERFDILEDYTIKNTLFTSPNKYMESFERIVSQFNQYSDDYSYRFLPRYIIKNIVNGTRKNHSKLLQTRLKDHIDYITNNKLDSKFSLNLIRDVFDKKPRSAKRILARASKLFDKKIDHVDLANLSPQFLGYACINHPKNVNEYLQKAQRQILELVHDSRFEMFDVDNIRDVFLEHQDIARNALLEISDTISGAQSNKRLSKLGNQTIRRAILQHGPKVGMILLKNLVKSKPSSI